jgi:acetylornithine deacetylase/succinyl-diaminopimelate desuccinylase-like protein
LELEKAAKSELEYETVATVGVIDIHSGAMNVMPGEVEIRIDIRSTSLESRQRVLNHLFESIFAVKRNREVKIVSEEISSEEPVLLSSGLMDTLKNICIEKDIYLFI